MATVVVNPTWRLTFKGQVAGLMRFAGQTGRDAVKAEMVNSTPAGRTYTRGGRTWVASAPGQPPAIVTGTLLRSISYVATQTSATVGILGSSKAAEYAAALEYGTQSIAPRPFARPGMAKALVLIRAALARGTVTAREGV